MLAEQLPGVEDYVKAGYHRLFNTLNTAAQTENQFSKLLRDHPGLKNSNAFVEMSTLTAVSLPDAFGKLIAETDLQKAFLSLGRYVRSFEDAAYVVDKLNLLLEERLSNPFDINTAIAAMQLLIACCETYLEAFSKLTVCLPKSDSQGKP